MLRLPFPTPADLPDETTARKAAEELAAIVDSARVRASEPFSLQVEVPDALRTIDQHSYAYFCLSADEIALIDDAVEFTIPALQPHEGHFPKLWGAPDEAQRTCMLEPLPRACAFGSEVKIVLRHVL